MNWLQRMLITVPADNETELHSDNIKSVRRAKPEERDAMQTIQNEHPFDWTQR